MLLPREATIQKRHSRSEFAKKWKESMEEAYQVALSTSRKAASQRKQNYDKKVRFVKLVAGDRVLMRNLTHRNGPGKLPSFWEQEIYHVMNRNGDTSVYEITPESGRGRNSVMNCQLKLTINTQWNQGPATSFCHNHPLMSYPTEFVEVEPEHEEKDPTLLFPGNLREFQQLKRNNKLTGEPLRCERMEAAILILPSLIVEKIRDDLQLSICKEAAFPVSSPSVSILQ